MGLFDYIAQACQSLAATAAPSVTAMGTHIILALATIMLVWFGVQESLGSGFSMGRFLNLFMLLTFAYAMTAFYDTAIPGLDFSLKGLIDGGTANLGPPKDAVARAAEVVAYKLAEANSCNGLMPGVECNTIGGDDVSVRLALALNF